ncbi:MAG: ferrochelatase [Thermodesulfovibrio sp.]|nr:ferrochelatase [Thermodesulfovibrio sp.]
MAKKGVLLLNMGGPDSIDAVKPFLFNLFNDPYIANFGILQKPLSWFITTLRSEKVKQAYRLIGGKSPLKEITLQQAHELEKKLGRDYKVKVGMNYWHPFIEKSLKEFEDEGIKYIIAVSLYPQYCHATTASAIEKFKRFAKGRFDYKIISSWYENPLYIEAWIENIKETINKYGNAFILFSAHGIPVSLYKKGDPYISETEGTVRLIIRKMHLTEWKLCYQSRTGPVKWVEPSTEETIKEIAKQGVKKAFIIPISFVSDHIETLYEIDIVYTEMAKKLGLELIRVPSLNTKPKFIEALKSLVIS